MDTVRHTAKAILTVTDTRSAEQPNGEIIMVKGARSGRWNLPGGGIEPGERPEDALERELCEELGGHALGCTEFTESRYEVCGRTTPTGETAVHAKWYVLTGNCAIDKNNLCPVDDEIQTFEIMSREKALGLTRLSVLAEKAILLNIIELHQRSLGLSGRQRHSESPLPVVAHHVIPVLQ